MSRRIALTTAAVAAAVLTGLLPVNLRGVSADEYDQQIAALQVQASALQQQITSVNQQGSTAVGQLMKVQQALAQTQSQVLSAQVQLNAANQRLAVTTANLRAAQQRLTADRHELSRIVMAIYESEGNDSATAALIDSKSFLSALELMSRYSQVSDRMQSLVSDVRTQQDQLLAQQAQQTEDQQQANAFVTQLQGLAAQQTSQQQQFEQQASSLNGQAASLVQQLHAVEGQISAVRAAKAAQAAIGGGVVLDGALSPFAFGPRADYFPWGQCTWYVASLRDVTWSGDAWEWAGTAASAGQHEGLTPQRGAIVVWGRGNGYSGFGHVAYVVAVTGPTSFIVDEANYVGLGIVDQRTVGSLNDVEAFIY